MKIELVAMRPPTGRFGQSSGVAPKYIGRPVGCANIEAMRAASKTLNVASWEVLFKLSSPTKYFVGARSHFRD